MAYKDDYYLDIEVKSCDYPKNKFKAIEQLQRAIHHCYVLKNKKVFTMYAGAYNDTYKLCIVPNKYRCIK